MSFNIRLYQETDFAPVLSLINTAARADGDPYLHTQASLRSRLDTPHAAPHIDPTQDTWVAEWPSAGVVAYADGVLRGSESEWIYRTQCYVHPHFRRQGIGRALLERQWERVKEISAQLGGARTDNVRIILAARAFDTQPDALALFEALSMKRVRYFFVMRRNLAEPIPPLNVPPGLNVCLWSERRDDRAVWAASQEAFADHWGHQPEPFQVLENRIQAGHINPACSFIAWDGDEVAGGALNRMNVMAIEQDQPNQVGLLFVRRPWRKRGLGRALLVASMNHARQLGQPAVILNVDAENLTGAVRLYESVGFTVASTRIAYQRPYP